ncbi:MAG: M1 family aminopeptidase [Streptosporangiaceae bacterium]
MRRARVVRHYEQILGVPCPDPKYDIAFVPDLTAMAVSIPGLMMVNESLLARLSDAEDDTVPMVCAHEVAHLWFGGVVSMRWWDDVWLDEAMATYMSYTAGIDGFAEPWTAFCYRDEPRAYLADELPGREPVSSPVAKRGRGAAAAVRADVLQGRGGGQAAGRADRGRRAAGGARLVHAGVRRAQDGPR